MRVGVYVDLGAPTAGGGYRFQDDVFSAFVRMAETSHHSFTVICKPEFAEAIKSKLAKHIALRPFREERPSLLGRLPVARRLVPRPSSLDDEAVAAGLEFMWFVGAPGRVVDLPYATVVWDLQHRSHPWFPEVSADGAWDHREALFRTILGRATAVIVGTSAGKEEVSTFFQVPSERIFILPHPTPDFALEAARTDVDLEKKYGLAKPFVLYPAQFWAHKNHVGLLQAVARLRDQFGLIVHLALVGSDQGNRAHVRAWMEKLQLIDQVRYLGFVPQADLVQLYRECVALTYVSFCGPENLPPLEAFALGCPVIAADVKGASEQLGDAALLVNPEDPEDIAKAIKRMLDDPESRQQLIQKGRVRSTRCKSGDFVRGIFAILDRFEAVRRSWA